MLRLIDPRRLGRVRLDPPLDHLGPDAATITAARFDAALGRGRGPVKARLLDQHALAGVGNLLADDILWRAALNPARPVDSLAGARARTAAPDACAPRSPTHSRDGGVHTLPLVPHRRPGGRCPHDGTALLRATVGGRTTYWCPEEQAG